MQLTPRLPKCLRHVPQACLRSLITVEIILIFTSCVLENKYQEAAQPFDRSVIFQSNVCITADLSVQRGGRLGFL